MVQPLEDEKAGAKGGDGTVQEEARRGARGVIRFLLVIKVGVQKKIEALLGAFPMRDYSGGEVNEQGKWLSGKRISVMNIC